MDLRFVDFIFTTDMMKNPRLLADVEAVKATDAEHVNMMQLVLVPMIPGT